MLKHHQLLCVLMAGGVAVPTVTGQADDLRAGLDATVTRIEQLLGVRDDIEARRAGAIDSLLEATDTPLPSSRERDDAHAHLRDDVAQLQAQLDELDRVAIERLMDDPRGAGMTAAQRDSAVLGGPAPVVTPVQEPEGYSADPVREARLLIRAKRFAEAETLLASLKASPETRYWRARALVGLGRDNEAIAELEQVASSEPDATDLQRWAQQDKKMIEVRLELTRKDGDSK